MKLSFDLHIHSEFSRDGRCSVEEIIDRAVSIGLDGISIADHDTVRGSLAAEKHRKLIVIPGQEVSTTRGHIIVLGMREEIRKVTPQELIDLAHDSNSLVVVPHPFHPLRHSIGNFSDLKVDCVEGFNAKYIFSAANLRAVEEAQRLGLPIVAGSDAHSAGEIGSGRTYVEVDGNSVDDVLEAIRRGRTMIEGRKIPTLQYIKGGVAGWWRKVGCRLRRE